MKRRTRPALAAWIVEQRKARGWTPDDVALRAGVATTTVRGWETGRSVSDANLTALEEAFGVEAPELPGAPEGLEDLGSSIRLMATTLEILASQDARILTLEREAAEARERVAQLEAVVDGLVARAISDDPAPRARPVKAG